jgi:cytochrome c556
MHLRALPILLALYAVPLFAADHAHHPLEQRKPIRLAAEEKAHIHLEMRLFLSGTQKIVTGASANDMKMVAESARELGMAAAHEVPARLREKLPLEFRKLGQATHQGFDDLARDAESLGDANHALKQLGQVMGNCVSCHAMYRLETGKH